MHCQIILKESKLIAYETFNLKRNYVLLIFLRESILFQNLDLRYRVIFLRCCGTFLRSSLPPVFKMHTSLDATTFKSLSWDHRDWKRSVNMLHFFTLRYVCLKMKAYKRGKKVTRVFHWCTSSVNCKAS